MIMAMMSKLMVTAGGSMSMLNIAESEHKVADFDISLHSEVFSYREKKKTMFIIIVIIS